MNGRVGDGMGGGGWAGRQAGGQAGAWVRWAAGADPAGSGVFRKIPVGSGWCVAGARVGSRQPGDGQVVRGGRAHAHTHTHVHARVRARAGGRVGGRGGRLGAWAKMAAGAIPASAGGFRRSGGFRRFRQVGWGGARGVGTAGGGRRCRPHPLFKILEFQGPPGRLQARPPRPPKMAPHRSLIVI